MNKNSDNRGQLVLAKNPRIFFKIKEL
jgi:hypothetical protein